METLLDECEADDSLWYTGVANMTPNCPREGDRLLCRVGIINSSHPKVFCAGADLKAINNKERLDTNKGGFAGIVKCAAP